MNRQHISMIVTMVLILLASVWWLNKFTSDTKVVTTAAPKVEQKSDTTVYEKPDIPYTAIRPETPQAVETPSSPKAPPVSKEELQKLFRLADSKPLPSDLPDVKPVPLEGKRLDQWFDHHALNEKPPKGIFERFWLFDEILFYFIILGVAFGGSGVVTTSFYGAGGAYHGFGQTFYRGHGGIPVIPVLFLVLYTAFYWLWLFPNTGYGDIGRCFGAIIDAFVYFFIHLFTHPRS